MCVSLAFLIQDAKHIGRVTLSTVDCPALRYFPHYLINGTFFEKKKSYWTQNVCFDFLYKLCQKNVSFYEELSKIWSKMSSDLHVKFPLLLSDFNENWIFLADFQTSRKSVKWEPSCSVRTDGRTNMTKLMATFRNFAKATKNPWIHSFFKCH